MLRLAETQKWTVALSRPGALRPGGEAWRLTLHVRAMHALVNQRFAPRWDVERWGLPINQADQAATLGPLRRRRAARRTSAWACRSPAPTRGR